MAWNHLIAFLLFCIKFTFGKLWVINIDIDGQDFAESKNNLYLDVNGTEQDKTGLLLGDKFLKNEQRQIEVDANFGKINSIRIYQFGKDGVRVQNVSLSDGSRHFIFTCDCWIQTDGQSSWTLYTTDCFWNDPIPHCINITRLTCQTGQCTHCQHGYQLKGHNCTVSPGSTSTQSTSHVDPGTRSTTHTDPGTRSTTHVDPGTQSTTYAGPSASTPKFADLSTWTTKHTDLSIRSTSYLDVTSLSQQRNRSCSTCCTVNRSQEQLVVLLSHLKAELAISKSNTSAYMRKRISVYESRPGSVAMGSLGCLVIALVLGLIVVPDAFSLVIFLKKTYRRYS